MTSRLALHAILSSIPGVQKVYFQPPPTISLQYPCIVYQRDSRLIDHADNAPYRHLQRYQITVMDRDPDSSIPESVANLPTSSFNRFYAADGLNHDVYNLFF